MYTGTVWGVALVLGGFLAALTALELFLASLFPRRHDAATKVLREHPWWSTAAGAFVFLVATVLGLALLNGPGPAKFLGAVLWTVGFVPVAAGLASVSRVIGEGMPSPADDGRPWRAVVRGSVTSGLAFVLPLVGWLLLLPLAVFAGLGAWLIAPVFLGKARPEPAAPAAAAA